jgi:hypothetical protein
MEIWYLITNSHSHSSDNVFMIFNIFTYIVNSGWAEVNVSGSLSYKVSVSNTLQKIRCGHARLNEWNHCTVGYARTNVIGSGTSFVVASVRSSIH